MEFEDGRFWCGIVRNASRYTAAVEPEFDAFFGEMLLPYFGTGCCTEDQGVSVLTSALIDITDHGPDSLDAEVQEIIDLITEERAAAMPWRELIRAVLETKEAIDDPICPICEDEKAGCGCFTADGKLVPEAPA